MISTAGPYPKGMPGVPVQHLADTPQRGPWEPELTKKSIRCLILFNEGRRFSFLVKSCPTNNLVAKLTPEIFKSSEICRQNRQNYKFENCKNVNFNLTIPNLQISIGELITSSKPLINEYAIGVILSKTS